MAIFKRPKFAGEGDKKRDIPQGLFQKCPGCREVVTEIELNENQRVCPRCDYHFAQSAQDRIANLLDPQSFVEMDADLKSVDTLRFQGMASYKDRLKKYQYAGGGEFHLYGENADLPVPRRMVLCEGTAKAWRS